MKRVLQLILLVLLPIFAAAEEPTVTVHLRFIELPVTMKVPDDLTRLYGKPGVDLLSAPSVTTHFGERAKMEVTRDLSIPHKGHFPTGLAFSILPVMKGNRVHYNIDFSTTKFLGFVANSETKSPMLDVRKAIGIDGSTDMGKVVVFAIPGQLDKQLVTEPGKPDETRVSETKMLIAFTLS